MTHRRSLALAVSAGLTLLASGCGSLDQTKVQESIKTGIDRELRGKTTGRVRSVACPEDRPIKQGDKFTCTATFSDGSRAIVDATQTSDEGDVSWKVRSQ